MKDNRTALHTAIEWGHYDLAQRLLNLGNVDFEAKDLFGRTVGDLGVHCRDPEVKQLVLQKFEEWKSSLSPEDNGTNVEGLID